MTPKHDPSPPRVHPFDALATIGCIYLALVTFGFAAFRYLAVLPPGAKRNQDVTFFNSANIVSLTGLEHVNASVANYPTLGLILLAVLAIASALTSLVGGGYLLARAMRLRASLLWLTIFSITIIAVPAIAGVIVGGFNGISASVGLGLFSRHSPTGVMLILTVAAGAIGLIGVLPLSRLLRPAKVVGDGRDYLGSIVTATALLVVAGGVALVLCGSPWRESGMESLALRGFGNAAGPRLNASPTMPWVTMVLSLIGTAPASVAGGLSLLPIVIAIRGGIDALRGRVVDPLLGVSLTWIATFAAGFVVFTIALAATAAAMPVERMLILVCSSLGNVGISYEPVGLVGPSLFVLSAAMLFGRLLPLVMLAWMACVAERTCRAEERSDEASR